MPCITIYRAGESGYPADFVTEKNNIVFLKKISLPYIFSARYSFIIIQNTCEIQRLSMSRKETI
jgi:hypothetical protein